ncbi:MAG TPA: polysaccharide biosynthesis/export family protein [Vicinamibacterales bacterium]
MKTSTIARFSFCFLLSTVSIAAAQATGGAQTPASPQSASTTPGTGSAAKYPTVAPDYKLVNGDKLRIEVYKDAQLSQSLQVRPDGKITLPLLGDIPAAGRTSTELQEAITNSLKEYIKTPVVTVIVTETVPANIYVMGEVNHPGPQPLKGPTSIMQALATAGGFTEWANTKDVQILRPTSTGQTTLHFNYKDAVNGKAKMVMLQPNDTVIVK